MIDATTDDGGAWLTAYSLQWGDRMLALGQTLSDSVPQGVYFTVHLMVPR